MAPDTPLLPLPQACSIARQILVDRLQIPPKSARRRDLDREIREHGLSPPGLHPLNIHRTADLTSCHLRCPHQRERMGKIARRG